MSAGTHESRASPHTLAGATVMQILPALHDSPAARMAIGIAHALVRVGARAIVAGEHGPLVSDLRAFGGEWLAYPDTIFNPLKFKRNVELLAHFVATERVDIVHARSAGAAWSALPATERTAVRLITDLPDARSAQMLLGAFYARALSSGDRVIARSSFDARPMMARYRIPSERVRVIPHSIDTKLFNPAAVHPGRVAALRQAWGIPSGVRVVLIPGRVAPWNGQMTLADSARILLASGTRGVIFVLAGDDRRHPRYVRAILKKAQAEGVHTLFRLVGHCPDLPAAFATADIVVVPCIQPPVDGRVAAEAQAMARPVITSSVGALPETVLAPPRMPDELRTGWVVPPDDPVALARALEAALAFDATAYRALAERARQFAQFMFSPESVANATLDVYTSLLQGGA
jgi:glycosyltransferase involved in cell wall biosynthesis